MLSARIFRTSKKIWIFLAVCAFAAGAFWFLFSRNNNEVPLGTERGEEGEGERGKATALAYKDTDNDGLKDWEESLYHADPNNADTDGDGTFDGEEVRENRNPTVAGPDDRIRPQFIDKTADDIELGRLARAGNLTQVLVNDILNTRGIDSFTNPKNAEQTSVELLEYISELEKKFPQQEITLKDESFDIIDNPTTEDIKKYFNRMASIQGAHLFPLKEDDISILMQALQAQNGEPLKKIDPFIAAIDRVRAEILIVPVPADVLDFHKKEVAVFEKTRDQLQLVRKLNPADIIYIITLVKLRSNLKSEVGVLHRKTIPEWLSKRDISFAEGEPARLIYFDF